MVPGRLRPPRVVRRRARLVAVLLALLTTTACVGLPDTGPVETTDEEARAPTDAGVERRAPPPQEGDSPQNIATGFFEAMTAYPVRLDVARQFLAAEAQEDWEPSRQIITYQGRDSANATASARVRITGAHWVDSRGSWRGELGDGEETFRFQMTQEDGEWRIADAPDALIVPDDWFQDRYRSASVYYLDRTASILVPEPVFVPADQLAGSLVEALLEGPGPRLDDVVRTFVPTELTPGLSVPVDPQGVAAITLEGDAAPLTPQAARLMVYQFAWTLRQDPRITGFRLTVGDQPVTLEGGGTKLSVDLGSEYDPTDVLASSQLFGVRNGVLESGTADGTDPVAGPFGTTVYGVERIAISLKADLAAAVSGGGTTLLLGSVDDESRPVGQVLSDAGHLLRPAWDFQDHLWVVDRTAAGARVSVIDARRPEAEAAPVIVPGITGKRVKDFLVSRDGTRLVAVVRGRLADELRVSRIQHDSQGRVTGALRSRPLAWTSGDIQRIRDIGWRSPTSVAVLHLLTQDVSLVVSVPVDGSTGNGDRLAQQQPAFGLVASPVANEPLYTLTPAGLLDRTGVEGPAKPLPPGMTVQYVG